MPQNMKNINIYLNRAKGYNGRIRSYCDNEMIRFEVKDKKGLELIKFKIVSEEFENIIEYEVFIDKQWFMRLGYNTKKKEYYDIKYNEEFEGGK